MKRILPFLFVAVVVFSFSSAYSQPWMEQLALQKSAGANPTFPEIQKAFNDYWAPFDVQKGYYYVDGEKIKAAGWKQFKRWEWFWNDRVDRQSGEFPNTSGFREYQAYLDEHPLLKSTNGTTTGNWISIGPNTTAGGYAGLGRLNCVAFSPSNTSVIYVGAASGGVWKSTNGGSSWTPLSDNNAVLGVSDMIVLAGTSGDVVYAATGDRDAGDNYSVGILKSLDGGNTWNTTGLNWSQSSLKLIYRLLSDPTNANVLYASTSDGVYKSTDGAASWNRLTTSKFINIKFKPGNNLVLYGSTVSDGDVYLSTDGGTTWTLTLSTTGTRVEVAVSAASPEVVYALVSNSANGLFGVYKSTNSGAGFTKIAGSSPDMLAWNCTGNDTGGQGWYDLCVAADPTNANIVFVGGVNTWKSINGGTTWTISNHWSSTCSGIATNIHADKHYLAYQPGTTNLFECNDGGLYKSANSGTSWTHLGSGMVISQMYRLGVSQTNSGDVITGLQDNGTKSLLAGTWKDVIGGDGMECLVDFTNNNVQYGELYYGDIYRTDNHWTSSTLITNSLTGNSEWVTPYVIDPNSNTTIYVGYQDVWKTTNKGTSWAKISSWNSGTIRSIAVAPSSSATIYAATGSILYRTTNGGTTWANITGTLPVSTNNITYVAVKQDDPTTIWVALGQFNANCVYQSTNGGSTWTNISTGLPSIPINSVIQNKQNTSQVELYAGTEVGVFIKLGSADWTPFFTGLPNVVVMELEIYYASDPAMSKIRAATFGRGLWESDVYSGTFVNSPPAFKTDPVVEAYATTGTAYSSSLADNASDPNTSDVLTFSLISGPSWLSLSGTGALSGTPATGDAGLNNFVVKVDDGKGGSDQAALQITVNPAVVPQAPVANFSATPVSLYVGQSVQFTDLSTNVPTSWSWSFGDGKTSILQNPSNTYTVAGIYTVILTATNNVGSDDETKTNLITVTVAPVVTYCAPTGISNTSDYISTLTIAGLTSKTGRGATGYLYYPATIFTVTAGRTAAYSLTPYRLTNREYWKIWIDFNKDGDFTDTGENVLILSNKKGTTSGSFAIPATAPIGQTRMRIAMKVNSTMNPCDNNYTGEVEDYQVNIIAAGMINGGGDLAASGNGSLSVMKLYPNPANSQLNISIEGSVENTVIQVYNILGSQLDIIRVNSNLMQLDLSRYLPGVYYILMEDQTQRVVQKFVKE